jgi:hypothetical protein
MFFLELRAARSVVALVGLAIILLVPSIARAAAPTVIQSGEMQR